MFCEIMLHLIPSNFFVFSSYSYHLPLVLEQKQIWTDPRGAQGPPHEVLV